MKHKKSKFAKCVFLPYSQRNSWPKNGIVIDVTSHAEEPYCQFSPFYIHGGIPIPGMPGMESDTVEGIWQGLKILSGGIATRYFKGGGRKRPGKPQGHLYGKKQIGYVEARRKIFLASYEWVLENRIDPAVINVFIDRAFQGITQYFHDFGSNGDINNTNMSLAHAALLVQYLNRRCTQRAERLDSET